MFGFFNNFKFVEQLIPRRFPGIQDIEIQLFISKVLKGLGHDLN